MNYRGLLALKSVIRNKANLERLCMMIETIYNQPSNYIPPIETCVKLSKELSSTPGFNEIFGDPRLMRALVVASNMYTYSNDMKNTLDNYQMVMHDENTSSDDINSELFYAAEILKHFKLVHNT